MAFDFKKAYKEFYLPARKPEIIKVPAMQYLAFQGTGDPNEEGGPYQRGITLLYAVAYTLKMSGRSDHPIEGFFEYVVPPLEGFWWQDGIAGMDYQKKNLLSFISLIRLPEFIRQEDVAWAKTEVLRKKKLDCSEVELLQFEEGLCVQAMHIGSFDTEPETVAIMHAFMNAEQYTLDFTQTRRHHEIYLSDPRKVAGTQQKTVIRHPIRKC
jgi:hypothetical protein